MRPLIWLVIIRIFLVAVMVFWLKGEKSTSFFNELMVWIDELCRQFHWKQQQTKTVPKKRQIDEWSQISFDCASFNYSKANLHAFPLQMVN